MAIKHFLFYLLAGMVTMTCYSAPSQVKRAEESTPLQSTLGAMKSALDWLESVHDQVNLDAIIGTRIVEGQLAVLLKHIDVPGGVYAPDDVVGQIKTLQEKADHISSLATANVQQTQGDYYKRIGAILQPGFWKLYKAGREVDTTKIKPPRYQGEAIHESSSDDCLAELFGSGNATNATCQVSDACWKRMTTSGYRSFSLSHEVFYLEIGEQFGCFRGDVVPLVDDLADGFCANMYQQAREIEARGFPKEDRDLFMEISALCGMMGYRQFFTEDWLKHILSWQWQQGCWGADTYHNNDDSPGGRFKREERRLSDGCECHRTAVAVGALSQYTRFILEFMDAATRHTN